MVKHLFSCLATVVLAICQTSTAQVVWTDLPSKLVGGFWMIECVIDDLPPAWFIVDTGAPRTTLDVNDAKKLDLLLKQSSPLSASSKEQLRPFRLKLAGLEFEILDGDVYPIRNAQSTSQPIQAMGAIGWDLFSKYVVRLDPERQVISITERSLFAPANDDQLVPIILRGQEPYAIAMYKDDDGALKSFEVLIDTGFTSSMRVDSLLYREAVRLTRKGSAFGIPAWSELSFGSHRFASVPMTTLDDSDTRLAARTVRPRAIIGQAVFTQQVVIFDYQGDRMFIRAGPSRPILPLLGCTFRTGMDCKFPTSDAPLFEGPVWMVMGVEKGSIASQSGLLDGDRLLKAGDYDERRLNVWKLMDVLAKPSPEGCRLTVQSGDNPPREVRLDTWRR